MGRYKNEFTFDGNGNKTQYDIFIWDEDSKIWVGSSKEEFIYDSSGNQTQIALYSWSKSINDWINNEKKESIYDANGNLIQTLSFVWDKFANEWIGRTNYEYTHGSYGYVTQRISYEWNHNFSKWIYDSREVFYYSEENSSKINEIPTNLSTVYPSPFSHQLSFSFSEIYSRVNFELFDMKGRRVLNKEVRNGEVISTDGLPQGVYLYNLFIDGKKQSGKLIKK